MMKGFGLLAALLAFGCAGQRAGGTSEKSDYREPEFCAPCPEGEVLRRLETCYRGLVCECHVPCWQDAECPDGQECRGAGIEGPLAERSLCMDATRDAHRGHVREQWFGNYLTQVPLPNEKQRVGGGGACWKHPVLGVVCEGTQYCHHYIRGTAVAFESEALGGDALAQAAHEFPDRVSFDVEITVLDHEAANIEALIALRKQAVMYRILSLRSSLAPPRIRFAQPRVLSYEPWTPRPIPEESVEQGYWRAREFVFMENGFPEFVTDMERENLHPYQRTCVTVVGDHGVQSRIASGQGAPSGEGPGQR